MILEDQERQFLFSGSESIHCMGLWDIARTDACFIVSLIIVCPRRVCFR